MRREQVVKCKVEKRGGKWRIVELEPIEFFAPGSSAEVGEFASARFDFADQGEGRVALLDGNLKVFVARRREFFHDPAHRADLRPGRSWSDRRPRSAAAISRAEVFFTTPTSREPSTLISSHLHVGGRRELEVLVHVRQQFRRDLGRGRFLDGLGFGRIQEVAQRDADADSQHQAGYGDQAPGLELLAGGAVGQIKRVVGRGTGEKALDRPTQRPEPPEFPLGRRLCRRASGRQTRSIRGNSRIRFMVMPSQRLSTR